jgi:hypothetical protein
MVLFRPIGHLAAWIVWHSTRVSLLEDLEAPSPPRHEDKGAPPPVEPQISPL